MQPKFYETADFWQDVTANLVAFSIVILGVFVIEGIAGRRIGFLHNG